MSGNLREEKAFEALIVDSLRRGGKDECGISKCREPNEKELAALRRVDVNFVAKLISGEVSEPEEPSEVSAEEDDLDDELVGAGECQGGVLFRCENVDEKTEKELEEADRKIIERRKKEEDGHSS